MRSIAERSPPIFTVAAGASSSPLDFLTVVVEVPPVFVSESPVSANRYA
ncbi:MAG: hypothetical protein HOI49_08885 [Bacteroidetes bacterium]|nr:hypothetical protein [Bacteroidota bacterium]